MLAKQLGHSCDTVTLAHYIQRERPTVDYSAALEDFFNTSTKPPQGVGDEKETR